MSNSVFAAKVSDFDVEPAKWVEVGGKTIAVLGLGDEFFATG